MKNWIVPEFQRSLTKQPAEEVKVDCDFSDRVPAYFGCIISATFSAVKWDIANPDVKTPGNDIFSAGTSGLIEPPYLTHARIVVADGTDNHDYQVTCRAVIDDGRLLEQDFVIRIREQ